MGKQLNRGREIIKRGRTEILIRILIIALSDIYLYSRYASMTIISRSYICGTIKARLDERIEFLEASS